jgi:hypothetical protein
MHLFNHVAAAEQLAAPIARRLAMTSLPTIRSPAASMASIASLPRSGDHPKTQPATLPLCQQRSPAARPLAERIM